MICVVWLGATVGRHERRPVDRRLQMMNSSRVRLIKSLTLLNQTKVTIYLALNVIDGRNHSKPTVSYCYN